MDAKLSLQNRRARCTPRRIGVRVRSAATVAVMLTAIASFGGESQPAAAAGPSGKIAFAERAVLPTT
jgi:hypothetical protein